MPLPAFHLPQYWIDSMRKIMTSSPEATTALAGRLRSRGRVLRAVLLSLCLFPTLVQASMFKGETLDTVANIAAWVVLIIAPTIGIAVFWLVHILPEKIAEKRHHPQAKAIQTLCLLSLFFGGMLWPLAWLWAYSKPVLYKMAYGTDRAEPEHGAAQAAPPVADDVGELRQLRQRLNELEARLAGGSGTREA
jgi:CBS domain containing-hemolysin-like protein